MFLKNNMNQCTWHYLSYWLHAREACYLWMKVCLFDLVHVFNDDIILFYLLNLFHSDYRYRMRYKLENCITATDKYHADGQKLQLLLFLTVHRIIWPGLPNQWPDHSVNCIRCRVPDKIWNRQISEQLLHIRSCVPNSKFGTPATQHCFRILRATCSNNCSEQLLEH